MKNIIEVLIERVKETKIVPTKIDFSFPKIVTILNKTINSIPRIISISFKDKNKFFK